MKPRVKTALLIAATCLLIAALTIGGSVVVEMVKDKIAEYENNGTDIDFFEKIVYHDIKFKKETSHGR